MAKKALKFELGQELASPAGGVPVSIGGMLQTDNGMVYLCVASGTKATYPITAGKWFTEEQLVQASAPAKATEAPTEVL